MESQSLFHVANLLADAQNRASTLLLQSFESLVGLLTSQKETIPGSVGRSAFAKGFVVSTATGSAEEVVLFWWERDLCNTLTYSTKHGDLSQWQDHWHQCVYAFPK
jgi:hypothetical protein